MAINPALLKTAIVTLTDKKNRDKLMIIIITLIIIIFLLLTMLLYFILEPIDSILTALGLKNNEYNSYLAEIQSIRLSSGYGELGNMTFKGAYCFPLETEYGYTITSEYGYRIHPVSNVYRLHSGIDMVGKIHGNILSIADGEVVWASVRGSYGNCVNIKHTTPDGSVFYSFYAHLSQINVTENQLVKQGQIIGLQGGAKTDPNPGTSTGSHLHFEIRLSQNGDYQNPRNYIF